MSPTECRISNAVLQSPTFAMLQSVGDIGYFPEPRAPVPAGSARDLAAGRLLEISSFVRLKPSCRRRRPGMTGINPIPDDEHMVYRTPPKNARFEYIFRFYS